MTSRTRNVATTDKFVNKALRLIEHLVQMKWLVGNPSTGLLPSRGILDGVEYLLVDYCRFAPWGYRKPKQIWGTVQGRPIALKLAPQAQCQAQTIREPQCQAPK